MAAPTTGPVICPAPVATPGFDGYGKPLDDAHVWPKIAYKPPVTADGFGDVARPLDLTLPPADAGPGMIQAGDTWNFQFWYRDPAAGGAGFNLSDGLEAGVSDGIAPGATPAIR